MTPHIPEESSARVSDWSPFAIMGNTVPPRDPDEDDDEEENVHRTKFLLGHSYGTDFAYDEMKFRRIRTKVDKAYELA
jgi:hypothetical protein